MRDRLGKSPAPLGGGGSGNGIDAHHDKPLVPILLVPILRTRDEAATLLRVSLRTIDKLRAEGHLRGTNILGRVVFQQAELDRFI